MVSKNCQVILVELVANRTLSVRLCTDVKSGSSPNRVVVGRILHGAPHEGTSPQNWVFLHDLPSIFHELEFRCMDAHEGAVWLCFMLVPVPGTFLHNEKLFPLWNSHSMKLTSQFT